jgi:hypothetical protein
MHAHDMEDPEENGRTEQQSHRDQVQRGGGGNLLGRRCEVVG